MRNTIKITAAFFMLFATLGSCTKGDKGATGATGSAGTNGTNGQPGTNGTNGTNGLNGNANVTSGTITVPTNGWDSSSSGHYNFQATDAAITSDLVTNGCVEAFIQDAAGVWEVLPATVYWGTNQSYTFTYNFYAGGITFFIDMSSNTFFSTRPSETYKVVAIGGSLRTMNQNVNYRDYYSIVAAFGNNIKEITLLPKK